MNESSDRGSAAQAARARTHGLVVALTEALYPTRVAPTPRAAAFGWSLLALALTTAGILWTGPMRPNWGHDLEHSGFALQLALGAATSLVCLLLGLEHDVPGAPKPRALLALALLLGAGWFVSTASSASLHEGVGLTHPAPSMLGKRDHCLVEGLSLAIAPGLAALWLIAGRAVRPRFMGGVWIGLAVGLFPALAMQLACMFDPAHAMRFHVPPVFASALAVGLAARFVLPRD